jgi:hypothetical protein
MASRASRRRDHAAEAKRLGTGFASLERMRAARPYLALLPALLALGCATEYAYVPTVNATSTVDGRVAADYPIPPASPQGDLRVVSYGVTEVASNEESRDVMSALHLRVVVENRSGSAWTLDTREQRVDLSGRGALVPAFASANAGSPPPLVDIDPSTQRVVDMFFLLPQDLQGADDIPAFDALTQVNTTSGAVTERTPFERLNVEPEAVGYDGWDYGPDYYWGGPYWFNPAFPYVGYPYGYAGGGGVFIHRSPRFWYGGPGGFHRGGFRGGFRGGGFHGGQGGGGHGGGGHGGGGHR